MMNVEKTPTRRGFLDWLIALFSLVTAAAMTIPGVLYLWPAAKGGATKNVEVKGADKLEIGHATVVQVQGKVVIVRRDRNGYKAFSAVCTHLGCLVKWEPSVAQFRCPCHAAVFDENGQVVSGPPPAPLPAYTVKEVDGRVFVSHA